MDKLCSIGTQTLPMLAINPSFVQLKTYTALENHVASPMDCKKFGQKLEKRS